jgi:hypothetical protein
LSRAHYRNEPHPQPHARWAASNDERHRHERHRHDGIGTTGNDTDEKRTGDNVCLNAASSVSSPGRRV